MKKFVATICMLACAVMAFAQAPSWVKSRPVSDTKYIGIGMAPVADGDYQKKATANALLDIASQISVKVESSSFMQTVEVDDADAKTLFEEKINESVAADLEGQELKGSYNDGKDYYVYFELDRKKYDKLMKVKREKGISVALDWYVKGRNAEALNNFAGAAQLYASGLKAVEPYLHLDLVAEYQGSEINLAAALYDAYVNIFAGMNIIQNVTEVGVEAFKASGEPLSVCLQRQGSAMPNVLMKASFVNGDGSVTPPMKTDSEGIAVFYITNVTSKQSIQNVEVTMDDSFLASLPASYRQLVSNVNWPVARFNVVLMSSNYSAYLNVEKNELEACERQVKSLLANNYFEFTEDTAAQLFVSLATGMEVGGTVSGELYDMNECYASLTLKIYDNVKQTQLLEYSVPQVKVLVPAHNSEQQAKAMCTRELMKRVKVELPKKLKKLNINL